MQLKASKVTVSCNQLRSIWGQNNPNHELHFPIFPFFNSIKRDLLFKNKVNNCDVNLFLQYFGKFTLCCLKNHYGGLEIGRKFVAKISCKFFFFAKCFQKDKISLPNLPNFYFGPNSTLHRSESTYRRTSKTQVKFLKSRTILRRGHQH